MKSLLSLLITLLLLTLAAPMSKCDAFTDEITAGMKIIWAVPTNVWPPTNKIWSYKVVPQYFSETTISNLMALGSFTMSNKLGTCSYCPSDKQALYFGTPGIKYLAICPALGYIEYHDEKARAAATSAITNVPEPVKGVPDKEKTRQLGLKYLQLAGIDTSQLINPRWWTDTRTWTNPKTHAQVDEVEMRAVDFDRRINGFPASGAGIAYVGFGNKAKVFDLKISWRNLEPDKSLDNLVTPEQIIQTIQSGKIPFLPRVRGQWTFGKVKTLTIRSVALRYELKPGEDAMDFATPILQFNGIISNGQTTRPVAFQTGIFQ
jgi:hypothetical protein